MKNEFDYLNDVTVDFSKYEEIQLTAKELEAMKNTVKNSAKKKTRIYKAAGLAACITLAAAFSQTAFAKELMADIIKSISTGRNNFVQVDPSNLEAEIPENLRGLFFDGSGKTLTKYTADTVLYDKDGNKITDVEAYLRDCDIFEIEKFSDEGGEISIKIGDKKGDPLDRMEEKGYTVIRGGDLTALDAALDFKVKLPKTLPEGFSLHGAAYFDTDGKYLFLYYTNKDGDYMVIDERLMNEETAFTYSTDGEVKETSVNGCKAVISNGRTIDWETGDVAVGISSRGLISEKELIKMAESVE